MLNLLCVFSETQSGAVVLHLACSLPTAMQIKPIYLWKKLEAEYACEWEGLSREESRGNLRFSDNRSNAYCNVLVGDFANYRLKCHQRGSFDFSK